MDSDAVSKVLYQGWTEEVPVTGTLCRGPTQITNLAMARWLRG